ncbi:MAG: DUF3108 domain-containing protein [PVC group bacterium]|nr:DUF3108 domain-containing protein [PVC group bacterium]
MDKKKLLLVLLCIFVFALNGCSSRCKSISVETAAEKPVETQIAPPKGVLNIGEKYFYKVGWLGLDVGLATIYIKEKTVVDGREVYEVNLTTATNKFFSFFYKVRGEANSYIDAQTFRPVKHNSYTSINKKKIFKKIEYDFDKLIAYSEDKKGHHEVPIPEHVLDPLGVFYYFSLNTVKLGEPVELFLNAGKKNFPVTVFVKTQRRIRTPAGRFWAFLVEPTVQSERQFDEIINAQGRMRVWFSCDDRRIPLIITLKIPVGTAKAVLTDIQAIEEEIDSNSEEVVTER